MCGIFCLLHPVGSLACENSEFDKLLQRRGPDRQNKCSRQITKSTTIQIEACVLHLRGLTPVEQPLTSEDGSFLLWNGEIFDGVELTGDDNDTVAVLKLLQTCSDDLELVSELSKIHGPWAMIYWQANTKKLWFGRDTFGRRSLLWKHFTSPMKGFAFTSVASRPHVQCNDDQDWAEVPSSGIYYMDLAKNEFDCTNIHLFPWCLSVDNISSQHSETMPQDCKSLLQISTLSTIKTQSPIKSHFNSILPTAHDVDLVYSGISKTLKLETKHDEFFQKIVDDFESVLESAVSKRVYNQPNLCQQCIPHAIHKDISKSDLPNNIPNMETGICPHSKIGILFSGGLDSTVLCILADRCLPPDHPIDLLNVAFEQCSQIAGNKFEVPDRVSGKDALVELKLLAPKRQWNFVEINIPKEEMSTISEERIADLVYPLETVLDNDIGCAVWFAARGCGFIQDSQGVCKYTSPSRVVLTGMGADEQLAGYSRHRICFQRNGWQALIDEMKMEIRRISSRNLGRDDRVISDHGREARFPFLDEDVVSFLNALPVWCKANLSLPRGIGDKFLLRSVARKLGLHKPALLAKRAIQFGSRIAKLENGRKGADICLKLKNKVCI